MSEQAQARDSIVVFPLGDRRFALPTTEVVELLRSGQIQTFPHTTADLEGVFVRRGQIVPVWNLGARLGAKNRPYKFWLIITRNSAGKEPTAIPVSGECQMLRTEIGPPSDGSGDFVRGELILDDEPVEVIDLGRLSAPRSNGSAREPAKDLE